MHFAQIFCFTASTVACAPRLSPVASWLELQVVGQQRCELFQVALVVRVEQRGVERGNGLYKSSGGA